MAFESRRRSTSLALAGLLLAWAGSAGASPDPEAWSPLPAIYPDGLALGGSSGGGTSLALHASRSDESSGTEAASKPKSTKKALLYSLLLPGTGELSLGHKGRATGFFIAEGLIWANFIYWTRAGNLREDDYIEQAQLNAGVGVDGADDSYWSLVGQYRASSGDGPDTYEEELRIEARELYPGDPAAQDAYVAENLPKGAEAWSWTSEPLQETYVDTRQSSQTAFNNAQYSFLAAAVNRVLSVIDVQLLRHKDAKKAQALGGSDPALRVWAAAGPDGNGQLVIQRRF